MEYQKDRRAEYRATSTPKKRIMVLNPNTSTCITELLGRAALDCAPPDFTIVTQSVAAGPAALRDAADIIVAERAVLAVVGAQANLDGLIIAAFGDPALEKAQAISRFPVVGLGASGMRASAAHGKFTILTMGAQMDALLRARVNQHGLAEQLSDIRYLDADIPDVAENPLGYLAMIEAEALIAASKGAKALLLGGAPFAGLGRHARACIPVIDGLSAAFEEIAASEAMAKPQTKPL